MLPVIAVLVCEYFSRFQQEETTELLSLSDLPPDPAPPVVMIFINTQEGRQPQEAKAEGPLSEAGGGGAVRSVAEGEGGPSYSR